MPESRVISPPLEALAKLRTPLTPGEGEVLQLLQSGLDTDWEIYVQPHLNGCRPDFVLLNPRVGIGVLEVKDWNLESPRLQWRKNTHGADVLIGTHQGRDYRHEDPIHKLLYYKRELF